MKIGFLKNNQGFSLIECLISITVFALMSAIVFLILSNALRQRELNDAAVERKNEQIAENVMGMNEPAETSQIAIQFFKLDGSGNPDGSPPVEINGGLSKYEDEDSAYSITKPDLDLSVFEYELLAANGHTINGSRAFYSTFEFSDVWVEQLSYTDNCGTPDTADDRSMLSWTLTLQYDPGTVTGGFVTYFKIPGDKISSVETDGNALVRSIFYDDVIYLRVRGLSDSAVEAVIRVDMDMTDVPAGLYTGLKSWFDSGVIGGGDAIQLVPDAVHTNNYVPS